MKRIRTIALVAAFVMVFALITSGCEKKSGTDGTDKAYKVGINTWGSGVPILDMFGDEKEYALGVLGCTVMRYSDDFTADKELENIQNMCSAGVDGIVANGAAVSTVPQMAQVCKDAKVPIAFDVFIGDDKDLKVLADTNEYYVGAIDANMVYDGQVMGQLAYDSGCRTACIIGGNIGDNNMDQRSQGFRETFEAAGGTVVAEARCTDNSEAPQKASDMLSANMDVDCIYAMVGDYVPGSIIAIDNLGLTDIQVFMSCVDKDSAELIKEGRITAGNDGIGLASSITPTLLLNYLDGHKILDEGGKAPRLQTKPFTVNKDNVDDYIACFYGEGVHPLTEEVLKNLCYRFNEDVTYQTYVDFLATLNLETIKEAHGIN